MTNLNRRQDPGMTLAPLAVPLTSAPATFDSAPVIEAIEAYHRAIRYGKRAVHGFKWAMRKIGNRRSPGAFETTEAWEEWEGNYIDALTEAQDRLVEVIMAGDTRYWTPRAVVHEGTLYAAVPTTDAAVLEIEDPADTVDFTRKLELVVIPLGRIENGPRSDRGGAGHPPGRPGRDHGSDAADASDPHRFHPAWVVFD
jgi:hypothetical protein